MSNKVELTPPAVTLINGIRAIGYSFSTAVADIIDNSISAKATCIDVYSDPLEKEPYFCILDNGVGMCKAELLNAMRFGSSRNGKQESIYDLGRFGLGLKSASLSQCRKLIVISKKNEEINAMSYSLDVIEESNKWEVLELSIDEVQNEPCFKELTKHPNGTLVIWKNFDKLEINAKDFEDSFRNIVTEAKKHVELVFHRFYDKINIFFNGKRIEQRDPFLTNSKKSQEGRTSIIPIDNSNIIVIPHTLPNANLLTNEDKALLGNPKSIYDDQGFYIYRNERLIIWGSWLHMGYKSELNKLARVQVDIPSSLDSMWMLDVKKSSAKIPDLIKDQIRYAIEDSIFRSHKTNKYKGTKELRESDPIWQRINLRDGAVKYEINRKNPAFVALYNLIGEQEKELLEELLSQIECYLPQGRIMNDKYDSINIANDDNSIEVDTVVDQIVHLLNLIPKEEREAQIKIMLNMEHYKKAINRVDEILRRLDND